MSTAPSKLTLETLATRVAELEQEHARQQERLAAYEAEIVRLLADRTTEPEAEDPSALNLPVWMRREQDGPRPELDQAAPRRRTSRRRLLQLGGATAAATVAAGVLAADRGSTAHAAPAHSDTTSFQQSASGLGNVAIEGDGTSGADGVFAISDSGYGVYGTSASSSGVFGAGGASGIGGSFVGGRAPLWLGLHETLGAPTSGTHTTGEIYLDSAALLWVCTAAGTPGTWMRLAGVANGTSGGATTFLSRSIRLLDTRPGYLAATHPGAPIQQGAFNTLHLAVAGVSYGGVTIPSNAQALVGNCTVVNPAGVGDLAVYPDLLPRPNTAVMHYLPGQIVSNGITIGLGTNGKLAIAALSNATDVIIDCQGYIS
jgi:hypothetical protein